MCPCVFRPRRGLGQASPSLEAPPLQALEIRDLFHQHNRKGKILTIKASRYIELVLGSFLTPETDMTFGHGVGASLVSFDVLQSFISFGREGESECRSGVFDVLGLYVYRFMLLGCFRPFRHVCFIRVDRAKLKGHPYTYKVAFSLLIAVYSLG